MGEAEDEDTDGIIELEAGGSWGMVTAAEDVGHVGTGDSCWEGEVTGLEMGVEIAETIDMVVTLEAMLICGCVCIGLLATAFA